MPISTIDENIKGSALTAYMDNDMLVLNFFEDDKPIFRTFCTKDDYISQDLTVLPEIKWKTASMMYLINSNTPMYWWSSSHVQVVEGEKCIKEFTGNANALKGIEEYQERIKAERLNKIHQKEIAQIDMHMDKFGAIPDDYQAFVEDKVFEDDNYIFYNMEKKKAYCSKCKWSFDISADGKTLSNKIGLWISDSEKIRHNKSRICPYCNSYLRAKSVGMGRKGISSVKWSVLVQSYKDEVLIRYFVHSKDFTSDYTDPQYTTTERLRTVHTNNNALDFEWNYFKSTDLKRWVYMKNNYGWYPVSDWVLPSEVTLYNEHIDDVLKDTCCKYSCAEKYFNWLKEYKGQQLSPWYVDRYLNSYKRNPWIEQLIKCDMPELVYEMLHDVTRSELVNIHPGRTICETLGISKTFFKILRKQSYVRYRYLKIAHYYKLVKGKDITESDFNELKFIQDCGRADMYKNYIDLSVYTSIHKLVDYINKQRIIYTIDYFDYIGWLEEMGYDMRNEFNLYPKNFKKAHDEKSMEYKKWLDSKHQEDIDKFNKYLDELRQNMTADNPMNIKFKGLFIRLPYDLQELVTEGESLHHCVATYRDKVAKGQTSILFIRKDSEPDKSYYTLEYHNRIIQCRGKNNCDMTPEVKAFVQFFDEKMKELQERGDKIAS